MSFPPDGASGHTIVKEEQLFYSRIHGEWRAHHDAVKKCSVLHRDVSVANIRIVRDGNKSGGIPIDWELSEAVESNSGAYERTGTRQFMSIRLLKKDIVKHEIVDDLEAFVWVLAWLAAKHVPSNVTDLDRSSFLHSFDSCSQSVGGGGKKGGYYKEVQLDRGRKAIHAIALHREALSDLLVKLWLAFSLRYGSEIFSQLQETDPIKAQKEHEKLENHSWIVQTFEHSVQNEQWASIKDDGFVTYGLDKLDRSLTAGQKRRSELLQYQKEVS
uniref:Fungal-type protein kinase domain-containing protein n=1 Tax=Moniliophthora roreri TaxID=221103 RepID=A0A0W0F9T5_MONRR